MNKRFVALVSVILLAVASGAVLGYFGKHALADTDDEKNDQSLQGALHVSLDAGKTVLRFDQRAQQVNGISVVTLSSSQHQATVQATGTVLQLQPFLDLKASYNTAQMDLAKARAAAQASEAEYNRLMKLNHDGDNASAKSVEAARATAEGDAATLRNAEQGIALLKDSVRLRWNRDIAESLEQDSPQFNAVLEQRVFLLQVAPTGTASWKRPPAEAIVALPDGSHVTAHLWSMLPQVDARLQMPNFLYRIGAHSGVIPGSNLPVFLPAGSAREGVVVPNSAVIWWQGRAWCYVEISPREFTRQEVETSRPTGAGWFVTSGLPAGAHVVTAGAQTLLSAEFRTQIQTDED